MSDTKIVDAQTGLETASGAILGALAGVNMMSGPGMLDFESCFSLEKLVIDAEIVGMAKRLVRGVDDSEEPLALDRHARGGPRGQLSEEQAHPPQLPPGGLYPDRGDRPRLPADLVRQGRAGRNGRAHRRVQELIAAYEPPFMPRRRRARAGRPLRHARPDLRPGPRCPADRPASVGNQKEN